MASVIDDMERQYYLQVLGVSGVGKTMNDLRYAYWDGMLKGTIGGASSGGPKHDVPKTTRARAGASFPTNTYWTNATLNAAYFYPVYFEQPCSINGLSMAFRAGTPTSVGRMGVFADNGSFRPGNILVQGTVSGAAATWVSTAVTSTPLTTPGWYWYGVVIQTAAGQDVWSLSPYDCVWFDAGTLEYAVRTDGTGNPNSGACLTTTVSGAFANAPAVTITGVLPYRMAAGFV